ncbi:myelin basic protein b isoform X1 [Brachyhypopomus gauderio]|uniref:myelin basic protein b isoform X1 n=2 Tax=Brachyhypopomus gauderio TaxID=698409 RepID=UPI0040418F74
MASGSSSGQSGFRLGRSKKSPGVLDQIGKFFGGDKKRKGKGSFRGALSASPQRAAHSSPRRRGDGSSVAQFFRSIVSPAPPKSRWRVLTAKLGLGAQKTHGAGKTQKGRSSDGQGTLTKIFKMGGARAASPAKR